MNELKSLNTERDIINIVGKILAMENRTALMEATLHSLVLPKKGNSSTDSREDVTPFSNL